MLVRTLEPLKHSGPTVIVEQVGTQALAMNQIPNGCQFLKSREELESVSNDVDFVHLIFDAETSFEVQSSLNLWVTSAERIATFAIRRKAVSEYLPLLMAMRHFAIVGFSATEESLLFSVSLAREGDRESDDFFRGILGATVGEVNKSMEGELVNPSIETRYVSALTYLQEINSTITTLLDEKHKQQNQAEEPKQQNQVEEVDVINLYSQMEKLQKQLNDSKRKYEALSTSRAGKLTLKYWAWRRGK